MSIAPSPILTRENYDADKFFVRHSAIEDFIKSPSIYHHRWILGNDREETDAMRVGSALHCLVLENQAEYDARFCVAPECDRRTKVGKEKWDEFLRESGGKTVLTSDQSKLLQRLVDRLVHHRRASQFIDAVTATEEIITFEQDGLPCKGRIDGRIESSVIIDLKTSRDPYPNTWTRGAASYGYHRQARWYQEGWRAITGDMPRFVFIVIGTQEPHDIFMYEYDSKSQVKASQDNQAARLNLLRYREEDDGTPWQHPDSEGVLSVSLPAWAFHQWEE